jgi:hypothetical protein
MAKYKWRAIWRRKNELVGLGAGGEEGRLSSGWRDEGGWRWCGVGEKQSDNIMAGGSGTQRPSWASSGYNFISPEDYLSLSGRWVGMKRMKWRWGAERGGWRLVENQPPRMSARGMKEVCLWPLFTNCDRIYAAKWIPGIKCRASESPPLKRYVESN